MCRGPEELGLQASISLFLLLLLSHFAPATVASFVILEYAKLVLSVFAFFVCVSGVRPLPRHCRGSLSYFIQFLFKCLLLLTTYKKYHHL